MSNKKKDNRGGARPGAGRPKVSAEKRRQDTTIGLRPDVRNKLDHICAVTGKSRADIVEELINRYVDDLQPIDRPTI